MLTSGAYAKHGNCKIDVTAHICGGAIVGKAFRYLQGNSARDTPGGTQIGPNCYIGHYALVGARSVLSDNVIVDDSCSIESDVIIGERSLLIYRAQVCNDAVIGRACVIGGLIGERVIVRDGARVFGQLIHSQHDPTIGWDEPEVEEGSVVVEAGAFVGFGAVVVGKIVIGERAYVCSGAVITKDIPPRRIAHGVNQVTPPREWKGPLSTSRMFE